MAKRISSMRSTAEQVDRAINDTAYDNVKLVADNIVDVTTIATAISDGTFDNVDVVISEPLQSNINTVAGISTNVTTVAGIQAQIVAVANDEVDIGAVASNMTDINNVALNIASIVIVAANIGDIVNVSNNISSVTSVAGEISNVALVGGSISNVNLVGGSISNVNTVAGDTAAINDVASEPLRSSILAAGTNATNAQLRAWEAEAERLTADSYANQPEDVPVDIFTSNGDGTFTATPTNPIEYSAVHWRNKTQTIAGGVVDEARDLTDFQKHGIKAGTMTIAVDGVDLDLINIASGTYYIGGTTYQYVGGSFDTSALGAGDFGTLGINTSGSLVLKTNDFFTEAELETVLELTAFAKFTATTIDVISESQFDITNFVRDTMIRAKAFEGTYFNGAAGAISENGTNALQLDIGQGYINTPDQKVELITADTNIGGATIYNVSGTYEIQAQDPLVISDTQYDDGTDLVAIPNNKWVTHTVARSSRTGTVYLIYGRTVYNSEGEAKQAGYDLGTFASNESTSEIEPLANIVVQESSGIVSGGIVDLRDQASNVVSTVLTNLTLQTAYDLSGVPEIQLASGKPLEIRNDVGDTNTVLQKWTNAAGTSVFEIKSTGVDLGGIV